MGVSGGLIRKLDELDPKTRDVLLTVIDELEEKTKIVAVGRSDFNELKDTVQCLAEAQERTEHRVEELAEAQERTEHRVEELAAAQERTEHKLELLTDRVDHLAAAQERTEHRVEELAAAQERTEHRVEKLVQAQERTEHRVEELAVAQTEMTRAINALALDQRDLRKQVDGLSINQRDLCKQVDDLSMDQRDLRKQVGGLSMAVGYGIEDKLIPKMAAAAQAEFGVTVSLVDRRNVIYPDGRYDEINIYCEGVREGKTVYVIGEAKAQPGRKDFDNFRKVLGRLREHLQCEVEGFMVGYIYAPEVEIHADEYHPDIRRYKTFQLLGY